MKPEQESQSFSHEVSGKVGNQSVQIEERQAGFIQEQNATLTKELMERICDKANLYRAYKKVKANKGSPGIDQMKTDDLEEWLKTNQEALVKSLMEERYKPQPVKGIKIPKPGGGIRQLGIPTVIDRFIQQAILQVLQPILDPSFSDSSYGFRPKRSAHDAIKKASQYVAEGYEIVVDIDLEKFFDRVNHDILMGRLAKRIEDKRLLKLIRRYLQAGMMSEGICVSTEEGTPQGGPMSPLLANFLLDELDKELERRGHRFCRYADDCNVYVKSQVAGVRVMTSITEFLEKKLKLRVNKDKSAVAPVSHRKFLGHRLLFKGQIGIAPQSITKMKSRVREITGRNRGRTLGRIIEELNEYLRGWINFYKLARVKELVKNLDHWIRRRLRCYRLKQCKRRKAAMDFLRSLGVPSDALRLMGCGKRWWHLSQSITWNTGLTNAWFKSQGLISLVELFQRLTTR